MCPAKARDACRHTATASHEAPRARFRLFAHSGVALKRGIARFIYWGVSGLRAREKV